MYFTLSSSTHPARELPIVVEIPHAGLDLPEPLSRHVAASEEARLRDSDAYVDRIFALAPKVGASLLVSNVSRYVIDLNRAPTDYDDGVVEGGGGAPKLRHGLIWRVTGQGEPALVERLKLSTLGELIREIYDPYHMALRRELDRKRALFGHVVLIAAHSMPSRDLRGRLRADIVPGTQGMTTAGPRIIASVERCVRKRRWSLVHDDPYRGGYTTRHYGDPNAGFHAIQVEINRRLYFDEERLVSHSGIVKLEAFATDLIETVASALG